MPYNHMIEHADVEQFPSLYQLSGDADVLSARLQVTWSRDESAIQ